MKIKPLADRVLVEASAAETKTMSGIIIPDSAKEKPLEGVVTAVGSGKILENGKIQPLSLKIGDRVLFSKYVETEINLNTTF